MKNKSLIELFIEKTNNTGSSETSKHEVPRTVVGKSLTDMYNEVGGVPVKGKYSEEIRKRETGV